MRGVVRRFVSLVSLAMWIGSIVFFSLLATPTIFRALSRYDAGEVVAAMFPKYRRHRGLVHEFVQSRGTIVFLESKPDGLYVGSLAGVVLGAVAGLLVVRGHLLTSGAGDVPFISITQLGYEIFFAALGLKGVAETATSNPMA